MAGAQRELPPALAQEGVLPMRAHPPASLNERAQKALLALVLAEHPALVRVEEAKKEFGREADRAIEVLADVGLLHHVDALVVPTRAAVHFERLEAL
jgi:predicted dehydrogenase